MFSIKLLFKGDEKGRKGRHFFFFKLGISLYFDTCIVYSFSSKGGHYSLKEVMTIGYRLVAWCVDHP